MNILLVDDAPEVLSWMTAVLQSEGGWNVFTAKDGEDACDYLDTEDIPVVVTDWLMPDMDGLSLIENIRGRRTKRYVYTLLMTARDREEDCVQGLRAGADDFLTKPVSPAILKARLRTARRIVSMQRSILAEKARLRESRNMATDALASARRELNRASAQQRDHLPRPDTLPRGITADWRLKAAANLSGDHLNFHQLGPNKIAFYLVDMSGHGLGAALRSSAFCELLRPFGGLMEILLVAGPAAALEALNRHVCASSDEVEYLATMVLGLLDTTSGEFQVASSGHPNPFLVRASGRAEVIELSGLPLGVNAEASFDVCHGKLEPGQFLLMHSDGVTDCLNEEGVQLGQQAFHDLVGRIGWLGPAGLVQQIEDYLDDWRGLHPFEDDVSVLALGMSPEPADGPARTNGGAF